MIIFLYVLGDQKNRLIETVLLSAHNIFFGLEIRKLLFWYALLSGGPECTTIIRVMVMYGSNYNISKLILITESMDQMK